jgi:hypothetical protein
METTLPTPWRCTACDTWNVLGRDLVCHCCSSPRQHGTPSSLPALQQAETAAAAAARQSDHYALMLAAVQAAQLMRQQPQPPACPHHHGPQQSAPVGKWVAVGVAGSVAAISLALSAVAVAVGAVAVTCCLIVLRSMWRAETRRHRR